MPPARKTPARRQDDYWTSCKNFWERDHDERRDRGPSWRRHYIYPQGYIVLRMHDVFLGCNPSDREYKNFFGICAVAVLCLLWSPRALSDAVPWCCLQSIVGVVGVLLALFLLHEHYDAVKTKAQAGRSALKGLLPELKALLDQALDGRLYTAAKRAISFVFADPRHLGTAGAISFVVLALPLNYLSWLYAVVMSNARLRPSHCSPMPSPPPAHFT